MPLAVKTADVATLDAFVTAVFVPPVNVPLAPEPGGANVTVTSGTGLPLASQIGRASCRERAVITAAAGPLPLDAMIEAAGPVVLVSEKPAGVDTPGTDALTV